MSVSDAWKKMNEEVVWKGPYWEHHKITFQQPDGETAEYEYAWHRDGVMAIVMNEEGKILVQSQFRPFIEEVAFQFPAGGVDEGESHLEAMKRELAEESNLAAENWISLGFFYPSHGSTNRKAYPFLATSLKELDGSARQAADEFELGHEWMTPEQVDALVFDGELKDGWGIVSWTLARPHISKLIDGESLKL